MKEAGFTIRNMAQRCGMTTHTLRYYERVGLIQPVGRAASGHRRYSCADEAWIEFLHCLRAANMPIRAMQRYAELRALGDATSLERRKILEDHLAEIGRQIEQYKQAYKLLERKITDYKKVEDKTRIGGPVIHTEAHAMECAAETSL
ncbi:MerR family transcriptional regulator [Telmatobacter bradus]|uniref:MerR family transcriptional regulator n=1 Tax=Telmatobacter bradus TaxID=474953 RepID=UPI003B42B058